MKKLKVDKYINDQLDESFTVPLAFIHILNSLLPDSAMKSLQKNGLALNEIIEASKQKQHYQAETMVEEKGINKKIVITVL